MPAKGQRKLLSKRFWEKVIKRNPGECWSWDSANQYGRYGVIWIGDGHSTYAHRVAYELIYGPIPEGRFVCHHCDNGMCVNPGHLFLGTASDNMRDMSQKGRGKKQNGELNSSAKLTEQNVLLALTKRKNGWSHQKIADFLGVCRETISHILQGKTWRHLNLEIRD